MTDPTHDMLCVVQVLLLHAVLGSVSRDRRGRPLTTDRLERIEAYLIRRDER